MMSGRAARALRGSVDDPGRDRVIAPDAVRRAVAARPQNGELDLAAVRVPGEFLQVFFIFFLRKNVSV